MNQLSHFFKGECILSKRSKSKRFIQQSVDTVEKHDERIPYHMTYAEAEERKAKQAVESSLGGA
ncbi:hypothetical protein B0I26_106196 [Anoxybacillus vitaminiphilus]|uniref:Uncharacterized protein n=1 Tax=Paranoxybacillus vitaminiphilus TaxID=581036 RepID=A0A327YGF4_9BACL|nr:hypothetical protein B0I26_106196 [Anoxybacillus vitaminiphilus]